MNVGKVNEEQPSYIPRLLFLNTKLLSAGPRGKIQDMSEPLIGTPRRKLSEWLDGFADDNDDEADRVLMPWAKIKYRARANAFRSAADMARRAGGDDEGAKTFPVELEPAQACDLLFHSQPLDLQRPVSAHPTRTVE